MPSQDLGGGYYLLHPRDTQVHMVTQAEASAVRTFLAHIGGPLPEINITRWAQLQLLNRHVARTAWKEKANATTREARNIKAITPTCQITVHSYLTY